MLEPGAWTPRAEGAARGRCSQNARRSASPAPAALAKSSLTDELVRRFRIDQNDALKIAIISIDPSRRKSGGALLGDASA